MVYVFSMEAMILETLQTQGPSSSLEVSRYLNSDLLQTMRTMHGLEARGLVNRVDVSGRRLFNAKPQRRPLKVFAGTTA